jgi:hypothetical protein
MAAVCTPVVEYSREVQRRAAEELNSLPDGSAIAEMLSDYAVLREQARSCDCRTLGFSHIEHGLRAASVLTGNRSARSP